MKRRARAEVASEVDGGFECVSEGLRTYQRRLCWLCLLFAAIETSHFAANLPLSSANESWVAPVSLPKLHEALAFNAWLIC